MASRLVAVEFRNWNGNEGGLEQIPDYGLQEVELNPLLCVQ